MESNDYQNNPNDSRTWGAPLHPADVQRLSFPQPDTSQPFQPTMPSSSGTVAFAPGAKWIGTGNDWLLNVLFVGLFWEVWICLYPLAALTGLLTLLYAMPFLRGVLPSAPFFGPGLYAVVLGFVAAAITLWSVSRLEHVLARSDAYRILRHVVRLPLLGLAAVVAIQEAHGLRYDPTPAGVTPVLKSPVNLAIVLGVMVTSHFILWNWKWAREFWHRRLASAKLRRRDN